MVVQVLHNAGLAMEVIRENVRHTGDVGVELHPPVKPEGRVQQRRVRS
jgi:hypothetical protein